MVNHLLEKDNKKGDYHDSNIDIHTGHRVTDNNSSTYRRSAEQISKEVIMSYVKLNYANPDSGLASRANKGKPYEERIDSALSVIESSADFELLKDEDMGYIQIYYKDNILATLSDDMSAMENWLILKPVYRLVNILQELAGKDHEYQ